MKGKRAARDKPGQRVLWGGVSVVRLAMGPLAAERVAFGLIDDELQSQHRNIIPHVRLQLEQVPPGALVRVTVNDALHQLGDGQRQVRLGHVELLTNVTRGMGTFRSRPSASCQRTCSLWRSSKRSRNEPSFSDR